MRAAVDSSILVAALHAQQAHHEVCFDLLELPDLWMLSHAVSESFSSLTGGRLGQRVPANLAVEALKQSVIPMLGSVELNATEIVTALGEAERRGIRGGAVYDFLHLVAAKKAGASKFYTLNISDFEAFRRPGDPDIVHPARETKAA